LLSYFVRSVSIAKLITSDVIVIAVQIVVNPRVASVHSAAGESIVKII
jgi:hypothetical protein